MRTLVSAQEGIVAIKNLDLSMVKMKLKEAPPEGKNWSEDQAEEAEKWYKRFLELCLRYPKESIVPNYPIDSIWHQHILDTRAYQKDCQNIFGTPLHHYPYFGLNDDETERDQGFDKTNELYRQHFGEDCLDMQFSNGIEDASGCGDKGSGTGCRQGCTRGG